MKFVQTLVSAVVCGFVLMLATAAHAQSTKQGHATIIRIVGEARYSAGDNVWHPLTVGQVLGPGNVIQTAANSKVDMILGESATPTRPISVPTRVGTGLDNVRGMTPFKSQAEQNVIRMQADSVLAIDKYITSNTGADAVTQTELDLRQGTIFGNVKKMSAASQFLIKMPNGIAGVRGTTFVISANGDITVLSGSIVVSTTRLNGQTYTAVLGPGDVYSPQTGSVTHLDPNDQRLQEIQQTAVQTVTVVDGTTIYTHDISINYVSPVN